MKMTSIFSEIDHSDLDEHVHAMVPSHEHFQATHRSQRQPIGTLKYFERKIRIQFKIQWND